MSVTGTSTLKERIAALQQRGTSPQPTSPPRSQTPTGSGGLRDKIARFEEKGGTPIPRGSFGLGAPPQQPGKRNNELWGNRIPSTRRTPSGNNTGSLGRSATLSVNFPAKTRRSASTSEVHLGELQSSMPRRESIGHKKEGSKESDVISSLDIGICTPISPTFSGRSYTQSLVQTPSLPEESTVVSRERDQSISGIEAPPEAPNNVLNSPSPIADLSEKLDAPENVPEHLSNTIIPASEAVGNSRDAGPVDAPLGVADINTQIPIIIEERSSPSSPSPQIDTSQPEIPLSVEVTSVEMVPSQGDALSELLDPSMPASEDPSSELERKLLVPCDALTTSTPYIPSLDTVDTTRMEEPDDHDKPSGKSPASEDDSTAFSETNISFSQISQLTPSSISEPQTQCPPPSPPPPPSLAYDSSTTPLKKVEVWTDVASGSQPTTVHLNHSQQSTTPIVVSPLSSSTTPNAFSNLTVEPYNPTVAESGQCNLPSCSQRPVSSASTSLSEASSDSLLPVSPILDAFPAVPKSVPSTSAPVRAHTVHGHRAAADRSSTSSIKSTPSLSFSSTSSSSTCSPIATSTAPSQPPPRRPAAVVQRAKSKGRPISSVPAWYDDDSDDGEAGWANVVVTRRYY